MWVAIVIAVIALLMVAFMPKPGVENARASKLGDFQVPRSKYGDPMPLVWGTVRQKSPITLWFGDFKPVPIKKKVPSGLFGSKKVTTGYKNYIGIDCALALGPNVVLRKFWAGTKLVWEGNLTGISSVKVDLPDLFGGEERSGGLVGTFTFYDGRTDPPRDAYLAQVVSPNVPAYNGVSRVLFKSFYIGTTTQLEMFSFEISRITKGLHPTYSVMKNGLDVNPLEICFDVFTSKRGCFGNLPSVMNLASFVACAKTLYDEEMGMSMSVQSAITGKDILEEIMRHCDGLLYQDPATSEIVAKLIRKDYDEATLTVLDESIVTDLKNFSKTTWDSTLNQCRVTFKDRAGDYDDSVAIAQDFANINYQQRVKSTEISSPGCVDAVVANKLAARQLSLVSVPLYKCDIVCNRKAQNLRPGDVFKLNWSPFGLKNMLMRVSKIDFGELTDGKIKITCVQDRFATSTPIFVPPDVSGWTPPETKPLAITSFKLWTPPLFLSYFNDFETAETFRKEERAYLLANKPSNASLYFNVYASYINGMPDAIRYLENSPYLGSGILKASYSNIAAKDTRLDTSKTLVISNVSLETLEGLNNYTTLQQARDGSAMLLIDNELFVYVGYEETGPNEIAIKALYRGMLDTAVESHAAGAAVWFIEGTSGLIPNLISATNNRLYIKPQDVSTSGEFAVTSIPITSIVKTGRPGLPLPVNFLTIQGTRTPADIVNTAVVTVAWRYRSRKSMQLFEYSEAQAADGQEATVKAVVRYRIGGSFQTATVAANSFVIPAAYLTGKTGTLEVFVRTIDESDGQASTVEDSLTATIKA